MNSKKHILIFAILQLFFFGKIIAQDSLKANVFHVDKVLKPLLSETMKIQSNPNPEVPEIKTPVFDYKNIPDTSHKSAPTIYTIKPLSMGTALLPKLSNNYVKFGYGNYNTPLLEVYYNTVRNKTINAGILFKHFSSSPDGINTFSNNTFEAFAKRFTTDGIFDLDFKYFRNNVFLYGANEPQPVLPVLTKLYNSYDAKGSYSNLVKDSNSIQYKIGVNYSYFSEHADYTNEIGEHNFKIYADIRANVQGNPLTVNAGVNIISSNFVDPALSNITTNYQRVFVELNPRYTLHMNDMYLNFGFNSAIVSDSSATLKFFPVAEAGYSLLPKKLTAFVGITGDVIRNTFQSIAAENPFVSETISTGLNLRNTYNNFEVYGGFKGMISAQTSFIFKASWSSMQNLLFYAVDSSKYNAQRVIYDTSNSGLFKVKAEIVHDFDNQFKLGLSFDYYNYSTQLAHPYSRPTLETKLNARYALGDKFIIRGTIFTMNKRNALLIGNSTTSEQKLNGLVDLNLGLDYIYNKSIGLFLNFNNLTNATYQQWYSYPVYGFNIIGGAFISF